MGVVMKNNKKTLNAGMVITLVAAVFFCGSGVYADLEFSGGVTAEVNYLVNGSVWIYDANVIMYEPAHIAGFVVTASGAVLDIYGGQIDYMLLISTSDITLPEGDVTIYGTGFAVDGVPIAPEITELFLQGQVLSGTYENGSLFAFPVDCAITGSRDFAYYQTIKLGWLVSEPVIEVPQTEYDFGLTDIGATQAGTVSVYNLGNASLTIQSINLVQDGHLQFAVTPLTVMPLTLEPYSGVDIEVLYSPVVEGVSEAVLKISSDDPENPATEVTLFGEGVRVILSPEEQAADILDIYEIAVSEGVVQSTGNSKAAKNKIEVFGKMLAAVEELLHAGYDDEALESLFMIEAKCDGQKSPGDFITGAAAEELNALIKELIETLQNQ